jgi:hypothetical protein
MALVKSSGVSRLKSIPPAAEVIAVICPDELDSDPHAIARLADATFQNVGNQQRAQALQAAERAIAIDPKLGVTHEALAKVRYWMDWDLYFDGAQN